MAHGATIQFYRGPLAGLPTLAAGEPAFTTDTYQFYIGDGAANHEIGAGSSYTDEEAQDAVGTILTDTDTVAWTYADGTPAISAAVRTQLSITSDASGIKLSGDSGSPGNNKLYGTDGSGTKGWYDQPSGGSGTVTSVALTMPTGFSVSGSPVTTSGTLAVTTALSGILKGAAGAITTASAGTDYEVPLTFSTGLTRSTNTVTVNTSQNIAKLSNLTSNGFVKTSGGDGTLSVDTSTYLTTSSAASTYQPLDATLTALAAYNANGVICQTAADTFAGRTITGTSGTITVTDGDGVSGNPTITIDATYVGQASITTLGTVTTGTWSATTIAVNKGGTGQTSYTDGQLLIGNSSGNTLTKATLTAGSGVTITNGNGSISIAASGSLDIHGLSAYAPADADEVPFYSISQTSNKKATVAQLLASAHAYEVCGRLTLRTGEPVYPADVTDDTLYFTPYKGNVVVLYYGSLWTRYTFTEQSLNVTSIRATHSTPTGNLSAGLTAVTSVSSTTGLYPGMPVTGTNVQTGTVIHSVDSSSQITLSKTASGTSTGTTLTIYHANYDVWAYWTGSAVAIATDFWTNNSTRATSLTTQDGVLVKSGTSGTYRYLGTVRLANSTQLTDAVAQRYLWNYHHRRDLKLKILDATASWTYGTAAWHQVRSTTTNRVELIVGVAEVAVDLRADLTVATSATPATTGIGIDSVSANSADITNEVYPNGSLGLSHCQLIDYPAAGYHAYNWLEYARYGTATLYGGSGTVMSQSGMVGTVEG